MPSSSFTERIGWHGAFAREAHQGLRVDLRALIRSGIHPALILLAFEAGSCRAVFPTGGFTIDKKRLLDEVLREEEFRVVDTDIDEDDVEDISHEDFDIPPALEKGGATR